MAARRQWLRSSLFQQYPAGKFSRPARIENFVQIFPFRHARNCVPQKCLQNGDGTPVFAMGSAEKPGSEEKYPKGMSLFLDALIKETVSLTNRPQDEEIILKSMSAHLAGIPDTTQRPKLTKEESFVFELFDIFGELFQSYEMVFRVGEIASLPFPESSTITELQFLEFIADGALNEFYIFEERLKHFIERLAILYRGDLQASAFRTWERTTKRTLYQFVSTPVIVRNKHVHRRRLLANDDQFKRAGTLEMLVKQGKMEKMKHL